MASDTKSIQAVFLYELRKYPNNHFIWRPVVNEVQCVQHVRNNRYDQYTTAAMKQPPRASSLSLLLIICLKRSPDWLTYSIILHSARVSVKVLVWTLSKSQIIQDGLKISEMADTEENRPAMAKYETMTAKHYKEDVDWKYGDTAAAALSGLCSELEEYVHAIVWHKFRVRVRPRMSAAYNKEHQVQNKHFHYHLSLLK